MYIYVYFSGMKDTKKQMVECLKGSIVSVKSNIDYYIDLYKQNKISQQVYRTKITRWDNELYRLQTELRNYE